MAGVAGEVKRGLQLSLMQQSCKLIEAKEVINVGPGKDRKGLE